MIEGTYVKCWSVKDASVLPASLNAGEIYFVEDPDDARILINHGNVVTQYAGAANYVIDRLGGGEALKAPSVRAVEAALGGKADLLGGKIMIGQLPPTIVLYRGVFATDAVLKASWPTDVNGAYATVHSTNTMWIWNETEWIDTGSLGATAIQTINGMVGPDVTIAAGDVGAYPAADGAALEAAAVKFSDDGDVDLAGRGNIILGGAAKLLGTNPDGTQHEIGGIASYDLGGGEVLTQTEIGSETNHLNLNSVDRPTVEGPGGKEEMAYVADLEAKQDALAANVTAALAANAGLSGANYVVGLDQSVAALYVDPEKVFTASPLDAELGMRHTLLNAATMKLNPMYQLYRHEALWNFFVETFRTTAPNGVLTLQRLTMPSNSGYSGWIFERTGHNNVWWSWRDVTGNSVVPVTYWVSPDGSDTTGDGSYDNPFATGNKAVSLIPEDPYTFYTVGLKNGVHVSPIDIRSRSRPGGASAINVVGESNDGTILRVPLENRINGAAIFAEHIVCPLSLRNFTIEGIDKTDTSNFGIRLNGGVPQATCSALAIKNCHFGLAAFSSSFAYCHSIDILDNANAFYVTSNGVLLLYNQINGSSDCLSLASGGEIIETLFNSTATGLRRTHYGGLVRGGAQLEKPSGSSVIPLNGNVILPAGGTWFCVRWDPTGKVVAAYPYAGGFNFVVEDNYGFAWQIAK